MNDGVTVCINVLRSIFYHLQASKRIKLNDLTTAELIEAVEPLAKKVGEYFAALSPDQMLQFRALRGVQGQTAGTRRVEQFLQTIDPRFDPPGLREYVDREKAQTTTKAFEEIQAIEHILQATVLMELRNEFGDEEKDWWFNAVPKNVRKKVDDRINEKAGKTGGREENFDLIDYREIILENWPLFEGWFSRGKGSKDRPTKWIVDVNELRNHVMHASRGLKLPISESQLAVLTEIHSWLETKAGEANGQ